MKQLILFAALCCYSLVSFSQSIKIDQTNAKVTFYFHGDKVDGTVAGFKGAIQFDPSKPESASISGSVDAATLNTGNKARDKHLKSGDFFEVEKYPTMRFKASSVKKENDDFVLVGKMTIKDVTREEKFSMSIQNGSLIFKSTINSADYGIMKKKKREDSIVDITIVIPIL